MRDEQVREWLRRLTRGELIALQDVIDDEILSRRDAPRRPSAARNAAHDRVHLPVRK